MTKPASGPIDITTGARKINFVTLLAPAVRDVMQPPLSAFPPEPDDCAPEAAP